MSNSGNANYTRIESNGTPNGFTPGFIAQAGTVGPSGNPISFADNNLDVNIRLVGGATGSVYTIGPPVPAGCVGTTAVLNASNSLQAGVALSVGWVEHAPNVAPTASSTFTSIFNGTAAAVPGVAGADINGGQVSVGLSVAAPVPSTGTNVQSPAVKILNPVTDPMTTGSVTAKLVYVSP